MRTFTEIKADIEAASDRSDQNAVFTLADEMAAIGTPEAQAAAYRSRGSAHRRRGEYDASLEQSKRSMDLYVRLGNRALAAQILVNMGNVLSDLGEYTQALEHFNRALATLEEVGNKEGAANALANMGMIFAHLADHPTALDYYHRSLVLMEEMGRPLNVATSYINIGAVYDGTGDHVQALEYYQRALKLFDELDCPEETAIVFGNIGNVLDSQGEYQQALEHYERSIAIRRELGNPTGIAHVMGNQIGTLLTLGQDDEASRLLDEQLQLSRGNRILLISHHANRAKLAEHRQDFETAHSEYLLSLSLATDSGRRADIALCHQLLRDLAQQRNDFAGYIEHNTEFTRVSEEVRGKQTTQRIAAIESDRKLKAERAERDKERALLYGALPESVAKRMLRGESVSGDHYENATVIFLDIAGFTSISDRLPAGDVVLLLEQIFSSLDAVVERHGVTKIKTIGDSYMAVAFPVESSSSEQRVADAAIEMLHAISHIASPVSSPEGSPAASPIQVRIGIHCGAVTAGVLGTKRLQYDVWGDTVNVASRMESTSEPGRIHVSDAFARRLKETSGEANLEPGTWNLELRGETELKGKGTMQTYWLESTT